MKNTTVKQKIYLCGPIMDEHAGHARAWRETAKKLLAKNFILLDPMRRNFKDREVDSANEIVEFDLQDIRNGTFTITNLGMYGVDCFNAVINAPQAAILATGRIAERVVPLNGIPAIQPVLMLSLSCDHRVVDGARGAQFLDTLSGYMEEPLKIME